MGYHEDVKVTSYGDHFDPPPQASYVRHIPFQSAAASKVFNEMNQIMLKDLRAKQDLEQNIREYDRQKQWLADGKNEMLLASKQPKFTADYWSRRDGPSVPNCAPPVLPTDNSLSRSQRLTSAGSATLQDTRNDTRNEFDRTYGFHGVSGRQLAAQRIGRIAPMY
jgi:hypothetical protein